MANVVLVSRLPWNGDGPLNEEAMLNNACREGGIFVITRWLARQRKIVTIAARDHCRRCIIESAPMVLHPKEI